MDIHPPHGSIHSFTEFFVHLLTVIIGILIALSLEGLLEWHHHRSLAREARVNLSEEIRRNREILEGGLARAPEAEDRLKKTIAEIESYRKNRAAGLPGFDWSFGIFTQASQAWNSAASTGAVAYMRYPEVQQYTRVYLMQAQFLVVQERALEKWLEIQKWAVRLGMPNGAAALTDEELREIERDASAALTHTMTEESIAKELVETYSKAVGDR